MRTITEERIEPFLIGILISEALDSFRADSTSQNTRSYWTSQESDFEKREIHNL